MKTPFRHLPILVKGLAGTAILALATVASVVLATGALEESGAGMAEVSQEVLPSLAQSSALLNSASDAQIQVLRLNSWANSGVTGDALDKQFSAARGAVERANTTFAAIQEANPGVLEEAGLVEPFEGYITAVGQGIDMTETDAGIGVMFMNQADDAFIALNRVLQGRASGIREDAALSVAILKNSAEARAKTFTTIAIAALVAGLLFSTLAMVSIATPIRRLTASMRRLADDDTSITIDGADRKDEIGGMAQALDVFRESALERERLEAADRERQAETARRDAQSGALQEELGVVLERAKRADFTARMEKSYDYPDMTQIAQGVNDLLSTVRTGVEAVSGMLAALANADLTQRMDGEFHGAFAKLRDDAHATAERLQELVEQMRGSSGRAREASDVIARTGGDLSERTESQAASLEETAAAMEQITSTIRQNSDNADLAAGLADTARKSAAHGRGVVTKAVDSMHELETGSQKISDFVGVIGSIATQTNLLALNAAVEAARSGEAGKGFAVVASEIRALAERASEATQGISELISQSSENVGESVEQVRATDKALSEIAETVEKLAAAVGEIAGAGREQASGATEVSNAINQMDQFTQANAGAARESAHAAENMAEEVRRLDEQIGMFRLRDSAAPSAGVFGVDDRDEAGDAEEAA